MFSIMFKDEIGEFLRKSEARQASILFMIY